TSPLGWTLRCPVKSTTKPWLSFLRLWYICTPSDSDQVIRSGKVSPLKSAQVNATRSSGMRRTPPEFLPLVSAPVSWTSFGGGGLIFSACSACPLLRKKVNCRSLVSPTMPVQPVRAKSIACACSKGGELTTPFRRHLRKSRSAGPASLIRRRGG